MAALTAEVIQLFAASISTSASVEVMLSLAEPQNVAEGLLGTLPSPPARIFYPDHEEGESLSSVWAQLEHYRDCFRRTISLCNRRKKEARLPIIKRWRMSVLSLLESAVESGSDVYLVGVSFELIKILCSSKDIDEPSKSMQLEPFSKILRTLLESRLDRILNDLTDRVSNANSSNHGNPADITSSLL